jgi:hypothetical protein
MYLARSKAGHDKDEVYVVLSEEGDFLFLANGTTKTKAAPKKKRKKHIQVIRTLPENVRELMPEGPEQLDDVQIKRIVKLYNQRGGDNDPGHE